MCRAFTCIDKGVRMLLDQQAVQHPRLGHEAEQIVVAPKEDVQAHLRVAAAELSRNTGQPSSSPLGKQSN